MSSMPRGTSPHRASGAADTDPETLWRPSAARIASSRLTAFARHLQTSRAIEVHDYEALWRWSVTSVEDFWEEVWRFFQIDSSRPYDRVATPGPMPEVRWFPGAELNYAERILARTGPDPALVCAGESGPSYEISWDELRTRVGALSRTLLELDVKAGDRVVAYLPNISEAVVAFLACASIGAVWAVCGPDVGPGNAVGRFAQLAPRVLFAVDGYRFGGQKHDRRDAVAQIVSGLPSLQAVVHVPLADPTADGSHPAEFPIRVLTFAEATAQPQEPEVVQVPAEAPLWVVYSSGTTGAPKGLVHSHVGALIVGLAQMGLQYDIDEHDRYFWYSSTTWVMWNAVVSSLLLGATGVLYDGSPSWPDVGRLWQLAEDLEVTELGVSPGYLAASQKAGLEPGRSQDLSRLKGLGVTGAPVPAASYRWVYSAVSEDLALHVISGGTDFAAALVCDAPWLPVTAGEISCRALGVHAEAWDVSGRPVVDEVGDLVVRAPIPSMPLGICGDRDGSRYRESYFDTYPGVWRHGDWVTLTSRGTAIVHGRSDSTLNRNGVRMGSSDIYGAVEVLPEIADSLILGVEQADGGYWMPLFVCLAPGWALDEVLIARIRAQVREHASPRHVPDEILVAPGIPRTMSGKKLEVPLKRIAQGAVPTELISSEAVDRPEFLQWFFDLFAARRHST